jgi:hypothetical protein
MKSKIIEEMIKETNYVSMLPIRLPSGGLKHTAYHRFKSKSIVYFEDVNGDINSVSVTIFISNYNKELLTKEFYNYEDLKEEIKIVENFI